MKELFGLILAIAVIFGGIQYHAMTGQVAELTASEAADKKAADDASANLELANKQLDDLKAQVADLERKIGQEDAELSAAKKDLSGGQAAGTGPAPSGPSLPSLIETRSGATYMGCVLSKVYPDGIAFSHSTGFAKVLFSDLDPALAASFSYDPVAAQKYENDQAALAQQTASAQQAAAAQQQAAAAQQQAALARQAEMNPDSTTLATIPTTNSQTSSSASNPALSEAEKTEMKQQIKVLVSDIRQKLGEMASVYARDDYATAANSQSSFRDTISDEIDKVNALQTKLGVAETRPIQWTPYYPYYVYNFMYW
jgi:hypothetical protein